MSGSSRCSDSSGVHAMARVSHRGIRHEMSGYSCNEGEKKITAKSKEHSPAKNIDESIISSIDNSDATSIEKSNQNNGRHTEDKYIFSIFIVTKLVIYLLV